MASSRSKRNSSRARRHTANREAIPSRNLIDQEYISQESSYDQEDRHMRQSSRSHSCHSASNSRGNKDPLRGADIQELDQETKYYIKKHKEFLILENQREDQKRHGFIPADDIKIPDFKYSFQTLQQEIEEREKFNDGGSEEIFEIWKFFIMAENSGFSIGWKFLYIFCCILSSYIYAFLAAFGE